jgi:hypothetical protein
VRAAADPRDLDQATVEAMWSGGGRRHTTFRISWAGYRFVLTRARKHTGGDWSQYARRMFKYATLYMPEDFE